MRSPVELNSTPDQFSREAIVGRSKPMPGPLQGHGPGLPYGCDVLIRGSRHWAKELVAVPFTSTARGSRGLPGHQLRGHTGNTPGKRALRGTKGGLYRRGLPQGGKIEQANHGTISWMKSVTCPQHPGQNPEAAGGRSIEPPWGREIIPWMCGSSPPPQGLETALTRADSGRICTTSQGGDPEAAHSPGTRRRH